VHTRLPQSCDSLRTKGPQSLVQTQSELLLQRGEQARTRLGAAARGHRGELDVEIESIREHRAVADDTLDIRS
jgi:hypothetical protein